jgi:hypothetical protein
LAPVILELFSGSFFIILSGLPHFSKSRMNFADRDRSIPRHYASKARRPDLLGVAFSH